MIKIAKRETEQVASGGKRMKNIAAAFREFARLDRQRIKSGLSANELERWSALKATLDQRFEGERPIVPPAERRESLRVPSRLRCYFDSLGDFRDQIITNLSRGGVFIRSDRPLPIGTKLQLRIEIRESKTELEVESVVVSNNVGPHLESAQGMGLRFAGGAADLMRRIDELYEEELERLANDESSS